MDLQTLALYLAPIAILIALGQVISYFVIKRKHLTSLWISVAVLIILFLILVFLGEGITQSFKSFSEKNENLIIFLSGFFVGIVIYQFFLRIIFRRGFFSINSLSIENLIDFLYGHKRYKLISDFKKYCKNGIQMIDRAKRNILMSQDVEMRAIQLHPQNLDKDSQEEFQKYLRKTYQTIFDTPWKYKRLVFLATDNDSNFNASFIESYKFVRTILLEYLFRYRTIKFYDKLNLPNKYNFGIGHKTYKKQKFDHEDCFNNTFFTYTSVKDTLVDLASKIDLHLPPGEEFSIAFSEGNSFKGFVRVCAKKNKEGKDDDNLKDYFIQMFDKRFDNEDNSQHRICITTLKTHVMQKIDGYLTNKNDITKNPADDLLDRWKSNNIDMEIFNYLSRKVKDKILMEQPEKISFLNERFDKLEESLKENGATFIKIENEISTS